MIPIPERFTFYSCIYDRNRFYQQRFNFFHPDFTVGTGISPVHALRLAGFTAGRDLHPALKIVIQLTAFIIALRKNMSRESFIPTLLLLLL